LIINFGSIISYFESWYKILISSISLKKNKLVFENNKKNNKIKIKRIKNIINFLLICKKLFNLIT